MTQPDKLSLEQVEDLLSTVHGTECEHIQSHAVQLGRQLADTMRENEQLRVTLYDAKVKLGLYRQNHSGAYIGGKEYMMLMKDIDAALNWYKDSDNG